MTQTIDPCPPDAGTVDRVLGGAHHDPHSVLGAHPHPDGTVIRVLRPHADEVHVVGAGGEGHALVKVHDAGLFSGVVPGPPTDYRLAVRYGERVDIVDDPYRWLPTLGEIDQHLIVEGRHERLWEVLGAHVRSYETPSGTVAGTSFAVWAPNAQGVRVTGDFDGWSGWAHPMRVLGSTGVWELFVPGIAPGTRYKFRVMGQDGRWRDKADPMAFRTEIPPATASIVDAAEHTWGDGDWMTARATRKPHVEPMSIYEMHLGSWKQGLTYRELAHQLVAYLEETAFTHVELLPVAEHPFGGSWGYQVTSYYAPTSRFGKPDDFRYLVDHLHQHGYGVIVDWVPAHFPRDEWALARFDGTPLYEHADPRRGEQPDWGTLVFDFGRPEVRNFLVANALYWLESFHIDGLRVDAVASMLYLDYSRPDGQWLPNIHGGRENLDAVAFLQEMNATVYKIHPGVVTIAEESTSWPGVTRPTHLGGLGFGFKWNMGWMHDTLEYTGHDPIYRGYHHNQMTFSLMYAFSENFVLPISHDEVVHGKGSLWERMPGDDWNKAAGIRALLAYMWAHPGKQLLFQGGEFGQEREWSEQRSLDWHLLDDPLHAGIKQLIGDLNRAYRENSALWTRDTEPESFSWIDANDSAGNVLSFLRHGVDADGTPTVLACVANFSGAPKPDYRVGLPFAGRWREVLNTDATSYAGSGVGNLGSVDGEKIMWHGRPASAVLQLPPSGVLWLVPEPFIGQVRRSEIAAASEPVDDVEPATGPIPVVEEAAAAAVAADAEDDAQKDAADTTGPITVVATEVADTEDEAPDAAATTGPITVVGAAVATGAAAGLVSAAEPDQESADEPDADPATGSVDTAEDEAAAAAGGAEDATGASDEVDEPEDATPAEAAAEDTAEAPTDTDAEAEVEEDNASDEPDDVLAPADELDAEPAADSVDIAEATVEEAGAAAADGAEDGTPAAVDAEDAPADADAAEDMAPEVGLFEEAAPADTSPSDEPADADASAESVDAEPTTGDAAPATSDEMDEPEDATSTVTEEADDANEEPVDTAAGISDLDAEPVTGPIAVVPAEADEVDVAEQARPVDDYAGADVVTPLSGFPVVSPAPSPAADRDSTNQ